MFNTIKSKIIIISVALLFVLLFVLSSYTYLYYKDTKSIKIFSCSYEIGVFAQNINKEVIKIEKNARDLALIGELNYEAHTNPIYIQKTVLRLFENYPESLGGGVWFKPYFINKNKRLACTYAFRNKQNKIVLDNNFESEQYNYPNQNWYKEISSDVINDADNVVWSSPYYENQGSYTLMVTAGSGMYYKGKLVGISTVDWAIEDVLKSISEIKPTPNSFVLFANVERDYILISTDPYLNDGELTGKSLSTIPWYNTNLKQRTYFTYHNKKYIPYVKNLDNGMVLIVVVPKWELFSYIALHVFIMGLIVILISIVISNLLYIGLKRNIIKPISKLIFIANKISRGEQDVKIKIEKPEEFAKLAKTFDKMTKDIKGITREREHLNSELAIAKSIQKSTLPDIFPPFPDKKEFDIYASMDAAKEVGGDFYDFYFTDDKHFMFLIADVSGKGIPAALFMMTAKTMINNLSQNTTEPEKLIEQINNKICANNKHGFFITLFAGLTNIETGQTYLINCGHNPPLIKRNSGKYEYLHIEPNFVLGAFENVKFNVYETKLNAGDIIFTYTDGVTEALNDKDELFGEDNLLDSLNHCGSDEVEDIVNSLKNDINEFAGEVAQSDDITTLIFRYNGYNPPREELYTGIAKQENYRDFNNWILNVCQNWELDADTINKIDMCTEEIYANIAFYAYGNENGTINVSLKKENKEIIIKFEDEGVEYNPLEKPDPDITLPPEERPIGGLGIYMVKQISSKIEYERIDTKNVLTFSVAL